MEYVNRETLYKICTKNIAVLGMVRKKKKKKKLPLHSWKNSVHNEEKFVTNNFLKLYDMVIA